MLNKKFSPLFSFSIHDKIPLDYIYKKYYSFKKELLYLKKRITYPYPNIFYITFVIKLKKKKKSLLLLLQTQYTTFKYTFKRKIIIIVYL